MDKFDNLDKLIVKKVNKYVSDELKNVSSVDAKSDISKLLESFLEPAQLKNVSSVDAKSDISKLLESLHKPAQIYSEGALTVEDFTDLVNMKVNNVVVDNLEHRDIAKPQAELFAKNVVDIVVDASSELAEVILYDVDPDGLWPRK